MTYSRLIFGFSFFPKQRKEYIQLFHCLVFCAYCTKDMDNLSKALFLIVKSFFVLPDSKRQRHCSSQSVCFLHHDQPEWGGLHHFFHCIKKKAIYYNKTLLSYYHTTQLYCAFVKFCLKKYCTNSKILLKVCERLSLELS